MEAETEKEWVCLRRSWESQNSTQRMDLSTWSSREHSSNCKNGISDVQECGAIWWWPPRGHTPRLFQNPPYFIFSKVLCPSQGGPWLLLGPRWILVELRQPWCSHSPSPTIVLGLIVDTHLVSDSWGGFCWALVGKDLLTNKRKHMGRTAPLFG